eukprot:CAMPEP_0172395556 /NCGR_PEP_ID=MMETSP1061-20121228/20516_1 /TAXON_ID=37318 /ORGANISM="Pseudo-nitzschia pungens, Strain cf. pungens" /LENGTH=223 /DNA_ID=CAMNT_0013127183 /DNA_START=115 /DNA_END=786 /DNA_ORIENTATION=+
MKNAAKPSIRTTSTTSSTTHYNSNNNSNSNSNNTIQDTKIKIKIKSALAPNTWSLPGTKPRDPNHNHQPSELPLLLSESEYYSDRPRSILQGEGEGEADAAAAAAAAVANESEERPGHYSDDRDDCNNFEEEEESSLAGEWTLSLPLPLPLSLPLSSRIYWVPTFRNGGASGVEVVGDYDDDDDDDDDDCRRRASGAVSDRQPAASKRMKVLEKSLDLPYFWW